VGKMESHVAHCLLSLALDGLQLSSSGPGWLTSKQKVSRHPLKVTGGLGACLGASEMGKSPILQTVSAKINTLTILMKTVDRERYTTSSVVEIFHNRVQIVEKNGIKQDSFLILTCFRNKIVLHFLT
jgi:hypothetical protein